MPNSSGIYGIVSKIDFSKQYIGSAVNLAKRRQRHFWELRNNRHFNAKLQNYWNSHGPDCFFFYVIEHVSVKNLISREQFHINEKHPFFNINPQANSRLGSHHTIKTKLQIKTKLLGNSNVSMARHLWHRVAKQPL